MWHLGQHGGMRTATCTRRLKVYRDERSWRFEGRPRLRFWLQRHGPWLPRHMLLRLLWLLLWLLLRLMIHHHLLLLSSLLRRQLSLPGQRLAQRMLLRLRRLWQRRLLEGWLLRWPRSRRGTCAGKLGPLGGLGAKAGLLSIVLHHVRLERVQKRPATRTKRCHAVSAAVNLARVLQECGSKQARFGFPFEHVLEPEGAQHAHDVGVADGRAALLDSLDT